jgi:hypothetical protein
MHLDVVVGVVAVVEECLKIDFVCILDCGKFLSAANQRSLFAACMNILYSNGFSTSDFHDFQILFVSQLKVSE